MQKFKERCNQAPGILIIESQYAWYDLFVDSNRSFAHGQTYQSHVLSCVAALQVQQIIQSDNLVVRCQVTGKYLEALLYVHLKEHPNVGDIRGLGLFWGVEFVKDRTTKEPFNVSKGIANAVHLLALQKDVAVYPGVGTVDGVHGDHVLVAPPYNISKNDVEKTVLVLKDSIEEIFQKISS